MSSPICSEAELGAALDALWDGISNDCAGCKDIDCKGYVWLTNEDKRGFMENGIPFIRANGVQGPCFIDSYHRTDTGVIDPFVRSPNCPHKSLTTGLCKIHSIRPLVCRLYPLNLEFLNGGGAYWVLHTNCAHVRRLTTEGGLSILLKKIDQLLNSLTPKLIKDVTSSFAKAAELSEPMLDESAIVRIRPADSENLKKENLQ